MPYPIFDRSRLKVLPLAQREHDMTLDEVLPLNAEVPPFDNPDIETIAARMVQARERGAAVILMMGAHVIKVGLSRYVIAMMERGFVTHVGMNGAGPIHDFELALVGATTESVAKYISTGQFGLWEETGRINEAAKQAAKEGIGFGEAIGRMIAEGDFPHKDVSILAAAYRLGIPVTVHMGIGYDIIHELPSCDGAALGAASYTDFLIITEAVSKLEGGVMLDFGSAVMGPEVYLKALAMARNVARQEGREIAHLSTAVFDLIELPENYHQEAPKTHPLYYYRPWKTILVRTVADGGESFYVRGDHAVTIPNLWKRLTETTEITENTERDKAGEDEARIEAILDYWFGPRERLTDPEVVSQRMRTLWFAGDEVVDRDIRDRFGEDYARAAEGAYEHWRSSIEGRLALIILLDQFSRNMFRESAQAFAKDAVTRELTLEALELGLDKNLAPAERLFLYLPLEHSERLEDQERSVACFERLHREAPEDAKGYTEGALEYALRHKAAIERFGRFPHRNEVLGRKSTAEELAFLREHEEGF